MNCDALLFIDIIIKNNTTTITTKNSIFLKLFLEFAMSYITVIQMTNANFTKER